jgi:hypothetical protein
MQHGEQDFDNHPVAFVASSITTTINMVPCVPPIVRMLRKWFILLQKVHMI